MSIFSSFKFVFNRESMTLSADVSQLTTRGNIFQQVYPDSADQGFSIISDNTGAMVDYIIDHEEHDSNDRIIYWKLIPTNESLKTVPKAKNINIILWNI